MDSIFATRLTDEVTASGLSQQEVADLAGVPRGSLFNWMSGRTRPATFTRVDGVAEALGVTPRVLLG